MVFACYSYCAGKATRKTIFSSRNSRMVPVSFFLIRTCFFDSATIRKGVFYVNEISTQPIVAGWDMIPVARKG
jgi:hypothetical protein